jgi:hypothetical protein
MPLDRFIGKTVTNIIQIKADDAVGRDDNEMNTGVRFYFDDGSILEIESDSYRDMYDFLNFYSVSQEQIEVVQVNEIKISLN